MATMQCTVEILAHEVTCPGAQLTQLSELYLSISLFGEKKRSRFVRPSFPLRFSDRFTFQTQFSNCLETLEAARCLQNEIVTVEIVQVDDMRAGDNLLASYRCNAKEFLYPSTTLSSMYGASGRKVFLKDNITFPLTGASPMFEFSSKIFLERVASGTRGYQHTPYSAPMPGPVTSDYFGRYRSRSRSRTPSPSRQYRRAQSPYTTAENPYTGTQDSYTRTQNPYNRAQSPYRRAESPEPYRRPQIPYSQDDIYTRDTTSDLRSRELTSDLRSREVMTSDLRGRGMTSDLYTRDRLTSDLYQQERGRTRERSVSPFRHHDNRYESRYQGDQYRYQEQQRYSNGNHGYSDSCYGDSYPHGDVPYRPRGRSRSASPTRRSRTPTRTMRLTDGKLTTYSYNEEGMGERPPFAVRKVDDSLIGRNPGTPDPKDRRAATPCDHGRSRTPTRRRSISSQYGDDLIEFDQMKRELDDIAVDGRGHYNNRYHRSRSPYPQEYY